MAYLKSQDAPIHLLLGWWLAWLGVSQSALNEFVAPSWVTMAQYALLMAAFVAGHLAIKHQGRLGLALVAPRTQPLQLGTWRMRTALPLAACTGTALLLLSLRLSGALDLDFITYFAKLRLEEGGSEALTGSRTLDVLTKILAFPLSYTVILVVLASDGRQFRGTLVLAVFNLLCFSYLWQVNYPLIHLFWFLVFHSLVLAQRRGYFDLRTVAILLIVFTLLLVSAVNRFGGDVLGGLQRYFFGYHLIGFSFYDHQFQDPNSILHVHSLGRSSLGFLDQMLEAVTKKIGLVYQAASFENSTFNDTAIDIGAREPRDFNAFGTMLFSLYRDFHVVGILLGGFVYGAMVTHTLYHRGRNWWCGAMFLFLASSWMMGMMVNPLEQAYFWFAIVTLGLIGLVNRGIRLH